MKYLNLEVDLLRRPEYLGSDPIDRATWLNLMAWSASQENGGVIQNCKEWPDRKWQQLCGVTLSEVHRTCELFEFDEGGNLTVLFYPRDKETEVLQKREIARKNGKTGGRPTTKKPRRKTNKKPTSVSTSEPTPEPTSQPKKNQRPKAEGKGREGKEKERKEGERGREAAAPDPPKPPPPQEALVDRFPRQSVDEIERIRDCLANVCPAYRATPHLSQHEITGLSQNLAALSGLTAQQWVDLQAFRNSPEGDKAKWLFSSRLRLIENITEAVQKATEWRDWKDQNTLPVNGGRGPGNVVKLTKTKK